MNGAHKRVNAIGLSLIIIGVSLIGFGCENPGAVGSGLNTGEIITQDTVINVSNIRVDSVDAFSGDLDFFSAGKFNDPLFGDVETISLLKPALPAFDDSISTNAVFKLRLLSDIDLSYGATGSQADFDLVAFNELWRSRAWKYNDEPPLAPGSTISSFSINDEDSLEVTLSQQFTEEYLSFYNNNDNSVRDSLFQVDFLGLAIVPQNEAKIISFIRSNSEFVIEEADDTTVVALRQSATSIERSNVPQAPAGRTIEHNTLEQVLSFQMDLTGEQLGSVNISRVELLVYPDIAGMQESLSQVSNSPARPELAFAQLYLIDPDQIVDALDLGSPLARGNFEEIDGAFHFNITSFVNSTLVDGVDAGLRFFITLQTNDGTLRPGLIFNENSSATQRPRLIITSITSQ